MTDKLRKQHTLCLRKVRRLSLVQRIPECLEDLVPHVGSWFAEVDIDRLSDLSLEVALRKHISQAHPELVWKALLR